MFVFISGQDMHILQKVGFALLVFGLVVQVVRSVHYLEFGSYPIDRHVPLWLAKDVGIMVLIFFYSFIHSCSSTNFQMVKKLKKKQQKN